MGILGTLKLAINIATLGQVTLLETSLEIGGRVVKVTIDNGNELVRFGEDVFRLIPGEALFPSLGPLAGLLKNEIEDELILLTPLGIVPSLTIFIDGALLVGQLTGVIQHRAMRADELEVARYVFGRSVGHPEDVTLTNLAGFDGRPFCVPSRAGGAIVNLGADYVHADRIDNVPLLIHEMTHVWQIQRSLLPEIFLCAGLVVQIDDTIGDPEYDYTPGSQWSSYNLEQQAHIVENWVEGVHGAGSDRFTLGSPLFRYVNGNVRTKRGGARTDSGGSVRTWLAEAEVETGSLRRINRPRPTPWW
jgi:hypothetical protein